MSTPHPSSLLPPGQTFDAISGFLRADIAHEDTRQIRENVGALALHIDTVVRARRNREAAASIAAQAQSLARALQEHQRWLTGLGSAWHTLYELTSYMRALRSLRDALDAWLQALQGRSSGEGRMFIAFEQRAWRALGEALLLIDIYEQGDSLGSETPEPAPRRPLIDRLWRWLGR